MATGCPSCRRSAAGCHRAQLPGTREGPGRRPGPSRLAEDRGFEPLRVINPTRFPIVRTRPLCESSAGEDTGAARRPRPHALDPAPCTHCARLASRRRAQCVQGARWGDGRPGGRGRGRPPCRVVADPSCGVISLNPPRAGRQQGQAGSGGCARGRLRPRRLLRRRCRRCSTAARPRAGRTPARARPNEPGRRSAHPRQVGGEVLDVHLVAGAVRRDVLPPACRGPRSRAPCRRRRGERGLEHAVRLVGRAGAHHVPLARRRPRPGRCPPSRWRRSALGTRRPRAGRPRPRRASAPGARAR